MTAPVTHEVVPARVPSAPEDVRLPPRTGALRRALKHPRLMHYNRLAAGVLAVNLALAAVGAAEGRWSSRTLSYAALANIALAVVVRNQYVINLIFRVATAAPTRWPLKVRWTLGKVYHFGGLHVGGALAGSLWFCAAVAALTAEGADAEVLAVSYAPLLLLAAMLVTTLPRIRTPHHDLFERTHRFGGWASLALLWVQAALTGSAVALWGLAGITATVALPWLRLRKVQVDITRPSGHVALLRFDHGETPFAGSSTAVSRSPLLEWHSFANVPVPGADGFHLTVSRAGDWTGRLIDDAPRQLWVKGITTAGVANIERLFTKVVYVATGSGIGPCLPHLLAQQVPATLVWSTRNPRRTYGDPLIDDILAVQPDAFIWDTDERGKPDMVRLAYWAYERSGAEAVICISNKKLTWRVVHALESRGIPAYGAIWDS